MPQAQTHDRTTWCLVIPVLNEALRINSSLTSILNSSKLHLEQCKGVYISIDPASVDIGDYKITHNIEHVETQLLFPTAKGKLEAQTLALNAALKQQPDVVVFCDADVRVDEDTLFCLLNTFQDSSIILAGAHDQGVRSSKGIVAAITAARAELRESLEGIPTYVSGRLFALRFYKNNKAILPFPWTRLANCTADDMVINAHIVLNFGVSAVYRNPDARVYHLCPNTLSAHRRVWRRHWYNRRLLVRFYPDYAEASRKLEVNTKIVHKERLKTATLIWYYVAKLLTRLYRIEAVLNPPSNNWGYSDKPYWN